MGYLAIARKWRPTRFEDLVGQAHVVQTLKNAIKLERVAHAYLFSGARGVGKTTVARIFAMALRCPELADGTPYTSVPEGQAIAEGRSVDVVEIDGASNNGVEAVRAIRENVAYRPSSGQYKIYIIDEVHMLSLSAFNALLKTLEEPPPHVIFIFATTEVQKIPLTILSRCQRFEFRRLTNPEIVGRLKEILAEEKVQMTEDALRTLASYGDGSLRDSLSLLDQVLSYFGQEEVRSRTLEEAQVVEALGVSDTSSLTRLLSATLRRDIPGALRQITDIHQSGADLKKFAERCLEELRLLYLIRLGIEEGAPESAQQLDISTSHFQELSALAQATELSRLERMAQILGKTIPQLGWSSLPRFVLEMAVVRMANLDQLSRIEQALLSGQPLAAGQAAVAPAEAEVPVPRTAPPPPTPAVSEASAAPAAPAETRAPEPPQAPSRPQPEPRMPEPPPPGEPPSQGRTWKSFVDMAMKKRPLLGALLCHGEFHLKEDPERGNVGVLKFAEGSFYERHAQDSRQDIEELMRQYFGDALRLELASSRGADLRSLERVQQEQVQRLRQEAISHPSVKQMKDMLGADVIDVKVEV